MGRQYEVVNDHEKVIDSTVQGPEDDKPPMQCLLNKSMANSMRYAFNFANHRTKKCAKVTHVFSIGVERTVNDESVRDLYRIVTGEIITKARLESY